MTRNLLLPKKVDHYFKDSDGIPAILVFQAPKGQVSLTELTNLLDQVQSAKINGVQQVVSLSSLPPQATAGFFSADKSTALIPLTFDSSLETKDIKKAIAEITKMAKETTNLKLYVTGPAGIATDTLDLFSRADLVLIFSTVGLILILLIVIYRSPLLALIPLLAAAFVYEVVSQTLGLMGKAGLVMTSQTVSIMSILLFAAVIDYSLFVFSRYREELKTYENKYEAMREAMRETGMPVFFSGGQF